MSIEDSSIKTVLSTDSECGGVSSPVVAFDRVTRYAGLKIPISTFMSDIRRVQNIKILGNSPLGTKAGPFVRFQYNDLACKLR